MAKEVLEGEVKITGGDQAAREIGKVTGAEEKLTEKTKVAGGATADAAKAQDGLNASEGDFVQLLAAGSPVLAQWVDGLLKAVKVTGEMSTHNLKLSEGVKGLIGGVSKYASALTLLGAGGAAAAAVWYMVHVWKDLAEQVKKAREEAEAFNREQAKTKETTLTMEEEINKLIGGRRDAATVDFPARLKAAKVAERLQEKAFAGLDEASVMQLVAALAGSGLLKDVGEVDEGAPLSFEMLGVAAKAVERGDLDVSKGLSAERLSRFFARDPAADRAQAEFVMAQQLQARRAVEAESQLETGAEREGWFTGDAFDQIGPLAELIQQVQRARPGFEEDEAEQQAKLLVQLESLSMDRAAKIEERAAILARQKRLSPEEVARHAREVVIQQERERFAALYEELTGKELTGTVSTELVSLLLDLRTRSEQERNLEAMLERLAASIENLKPETVVNNYNPRNYSTKGRATNGQNHAERRGKD